MNQTKDNKSVRFDSNGNLLLSGEYVVIYGARALALPLRTRQILEAEFTPGSSARMEWTATDPDGVWFKAEMLRTAGWSVFKSTDHAIAGKLVRLIGAARFLNPGFLSENGSWTVHNHLEFNRNWGWGSGSTLLMNIARWAGVEPFALHAMISEGSGYDIACARAGSPFIFQLRSGRPVIQEITFRPGFHEHIGFVYLGGKLENAREPAKFDTGKIEIAGLVKEINDITGQLAFVPTIRQFNSLLDRHDELISDALGRSTLKKFLFPGFPGSVKWLGAWGGRSAVFCSEEPFSVASKYFRDRGYPVIFPWKEIVR